MHLEQRFIAYDATIRFFVIISAICYRFLGTHLLINPANLKDKIMDYTQIPFYNPLGTFIPLFFTLFLITVTKKQKGTIEEETRMHQDLMSRSIFPTMLIEIYFVVLYFGIRPIVYDHSDHFKVSGHLFRAGLSNGIWLRNYSWVLRHRSSFPLHIRVCMSGAIYLMLFYIAYENFWTALYFHTPLEVILGFFFATLNIFFPTLKRAKRWIKNTEEKQQYLEASYDI